jgi:hypothetical protein
LADYRYQASALSPSVSISISEKNNEIYGKLSLKFLYLSIMTLLQKLGDLKVICYIKTEILFYEIKSGIADSQHYLDSWACGGQLKRCDGRNDVVLLVIGDVGGGGGSVGGCTYCIVRVQVVALCIGTGMGKW